MKLPYVTALFAASILYSGMPAWSADAPSAKPAPSAIANGENDYLGDTTKGGVARWPQSRLPIRVFIKPGNEVKGYQPDWEAMLKQAFADWVEASKGKVKIEYVPNETSAEMVCLWTSNPKEMISSVEGGHAMVVPDSEGIIKTTVYLLTVDPDSGAQISNNIARRIDLHEIGHALGLLGHSSSSSDVMYGKYLPTDAIPNLTDRDKNTLVALYSLDNATVRAHPLANIESMVSGDANSNVVRAMKANDEAATAMNNKNLLVAMKKLEEAHQLDPNNDLYASNLGLTYGNVAALAFMLRNLPRAQEYFQKAVPLAEKSPNKASYLAILKNYSTFLHATKQDAEATKIDAKISALSGQ